MNQCKGTIGSCRMRRQIVDVLEQFRIDVNDAHAHAYDENKYFVNGSEDSKSMVSSSGYNDNNESDFDDTTKASSEDEVVRMMKDIGSSPSTTASFTKSGIKRVDSAYMFTS